MKDFYDDRLPEEEEPATPSEPGQETEQETTEDVSVEGEPETESNEEAPEEDEWNFLDEFIEKAPSLIDEGYGEAPETKEEPQPDPQPDPRPEPAPTPRPPYPYAYQGYQQPSYVHQVPYPRPPAQPQSQQYQYQYPYQQPNYGYYPYPAPQKKPLSTGTKVFIWVASVLAGLAILGFLFYVGYSVSHRTGYDTGYDGYDRDYSYRDYYEDFREHYNIPDDDDNSDDSYPWDVFPFEDDEENIPNFDEDVPTPDQDDPRGDIEIVPNTEGITIEQKPAGDPMTAAEVYAQVVRSTVTVELMDGESVLGTGTGIVATEDGYIITNSHVVNDSKSSTVYITTYDGFSYYAVVVGLDRTSDLAILKVTETGYDFTPARFGDSDELVIGDQVIAIGNPGGATYFGSMTGGYISGLGRSSKYSASDMTYIQTDAAVNPGNSGGPLVNMYGQVVGINSAKIVADGYEGMGFAIPISDAQGIINQLLAGGYVEGRVRMGIRGSEVDSEIAEYYGVPRGFMIASIDEISGFAGTDAMPGDIITAIDGETVRSLADISNLLLTHVPGDTITVTLYRPTDQGYGGETFDVEVLLLEDKGETQE